MSAEVMVLEDGSEITVQHFLVQPRFGQPYIACMPGLTDFTAGKYRRAPWIRTDEARSVNCPMCKKTKAYTDAMNVLKGMKVEFPK